MFCFNDFLVVVKRVWLYSGAFLMSYKKVVNKTSSNRRVFFPIYSFSSSHSFDIAIFLNLVWTRSKTRWRLWSKNGMLWAHGSGTPPMMKSVVFVESNLLALARNANILETTVPWVSTSNFIIRKKLCLTYIISLSVIGTCKHSFHLHCMLKWLEVESSQGLCPMCRQPFEASWFPFTTKSTWCLILMSIYDNLFINIYSLI